MRVRARQPRIALITLGCPKNVADSDLLAGQILREGLAVTSTIAEADAVLVNTCAFLAAAERESIRSILELAEGKKARPSQRLVVMGCLAQRHGEALRSEVPEIDLLVGPGEVHRLAPLLRAILAGKGVGPAATRIGGLDRLHGDWDLRVVSGRRHSAYVKISDGCDRRCSFCVIPRLRGPQRSRPPGSIIREVERLAGGGVREINLVAQELTAYGTDKGKPGALPALLRRLDQIEGIVWIRLLYTHPATWTEELTDCLMSLPRLCRYVDIPIQHVSERVLRNMRRPSFRRTRRLLERLREKIPGLFVRTVLLTGFPGETDEDFEEMISFVREYRFDHLGVFEFSPEPGTPAASFERQVPPAVRRSRRRRILAAQRKISERLNRERVGRRALLLLDEKDPRGGWRARHQGQAPEVDGRTRLRYLTGRPLRPGDLIEAVITRASIYDLEARPATEEEKGSCLAAS